MLLVTSISEAAIRARSTGSLDGLEHSEVYTLVGVTGETTADEIIEEVGKRIRQNLYRQKLEVRGYSGGWVDRDEALRLLREAKGEYPGISAEDEAKITKWLAEMKVERIEAVSIETNYMGGTGLEDVYIFVPVLPATEVLVIRAYWYSE